MTHPLDQHNEAAFTEEGRVLYRNTVLRLLSAESIERLRLIPTHLPLKHPLERFGEVIDHILFIESGVGFKATVFRDGSEVEVGLLGHESVIGVTALMGVRRSLNRVYMQIPGTGYKSRIADAQAEFSRGGEFQTMSLLSVQMQLAQATQSAACNAKHELGQRLARWLLLTSDRAGRADLAFSQQFLATTLGVWRSSVALAMSQLKQAGVVSYSRGNIRLLDIPALEAQACECYHVLKKHLYEPLG